MGFRLAHFTDIHITAEPGNIPWSQLLSKRFLGWVNLRCLGRYRDLRHAAAITQAVVEDLDELQPEHIVFTGDLTGLSLASEFATARRVLSPLLASKRITGIPGNHDVYVPSALRDRLYDEAFGDWHESDLPAPPIVRWLGEKHVLICLRDARPAPLHDSSGCVGASQLRLLTERLNEPRVAARTCLLALHYAPLRADGSPDSRLHGLRDAAELLAAARDGGVSVILHGHLHDRFVLPPSPGRPMTLCNPGSLTHARHDLAYHIYNLSDDGGVHLEARRYDAGSGSFRPWPEAPGTGRLTNV